MLTTSTLRRTPRLPPADSVDGLGRWLHEHLEERLDERDPRRSGPGLRAPVQIAVEVGRQSDWTPWRIGRAVGLGVRRLAHGREDGLRLFATCVESFVTACDRRGIPAGEACVGLTEAVVEVDPALAGTAASVAAHAGRDAYRVKGQRRLPQLVV